MAARRAIAVKSPDESTGPRLSKIISGQRATDEDLGDGIIAQETSHRTLTGPAATGRKTSSEATERGTEAPRSSGSQRMMASVMAAARSISSSGRGLLTSMRSSSSGIDTFFSKSTETTPGWLASRKLSTRTSTNTQSFSEDATRNTLSTIDDASTRDPSRDSSLASLNPASLNPMDAVATAVAT